MGNCLVFVIYCILTNIKTTIINSFHFNQSSYIFRSIIISPVIGIFPAIIIIPIASIAPAPPIVPSVVGILIVFLIALFLLLLLDHWLWQSFSFFYDHLIYHLLVLSSILLVPFVLCIIPVHLFSSILLVTDFSISISYSNPWLSCMLSIFSHSLVCPSIFRHRNTFFFVHQWLLDIGFFLVGGTLIYVVLLVPAIIFVEISLLRLVVSLLWLVILSIIVVVPCIAIALLLIAGLGSSLIALLPVLCVYLLVAFVNWL